MCSEMGLNHDLMRVLWSTHLTTSQASNGIILSLCHSCDILYHKCHMNPNIDLEFGNNSNQKCQHTVKYLFALRWGYTFTVSCSVVAVIKLYSTAGMDMLIVLSI